MSDDLIAEIDALLDDDFPWCDAYDSSTDPPAPVYSGYTEMLAAVMRDGESALPAISGDVDTGW